MVRCSFCDNLMSETDLNCPFCGTPHDPVRQASPGGPRTIYELKRLANKTGISLSRLHFHIGEDYKGRCAFGIYKDERTGNYVVYKNKDNGQRAIRYEGPDEAYAVNEIYQKLKERIALYRNNPNHDPVDLYREPDENELRSGMPNRSNTLTMVFLILLCIFAILMLFFTPPTGSSGSSGSSRYESSYDNDSDYSYSDWGSDSDYDDWSSDW